MPVPFPLSFLVLGADFFIRFGFYTGKHGFTVNTFALFQRFKPCLNLLGEFLFLHGFDLVALLHQPQGLAHDLARGIIASTLYLALYDLFEFGGSGVRLSGYPFCQSFRKDSIPDMSSLVDLGHTVFS